MKPSLEPNTSTHPFTHSFAHPATHSSHSSLTHRPPTLKSSTLESFAQRLQACEQLWSQAWSRSRLQSTPRIASQPAPRLCSAAKRIVHGTQPAHIHTKTHTITHTHTRARARERHMRGEKSGTHGATQQVTARHTNGHTLWTCAHTCVWRNKSRHVQE